MRALKYVNHFTSGNKQNEAGDSRVDLTATTATTTTTTATTTPTTATTTTATTPTSYSATPNTSKPPPRSRRSGLSAAENSRNAATADTAAADAAAAAAPLESEYVEDSDIFSDALLTEAEDSVDADEIIDYQRLHRASFVQRPPRPDYSFKVGIIGNVNVGKTTLLLTLTDGGGGGGGGVTPKVGVGAREKLVFSNAKRRTAKCRLEDTAGQERYKSLTSSFYRNCLGCLVIYDVTKEDSFNDVDYWFRDVRMYAEADISVVLVAANRISPLLAGEEEEEEAAARALSERRVVTVEEGERKAEQFEVPYVEANVRKEASAVAALETLVDRMIDRVEKRRSQTPDRDRYQSPDPRRSYRPRTLTRKSVIAIAAADAATQAAAAAIRAAAAAPKRVPVSASSLPTASNRVDLSDSPPREQKTICC